VLDRERLELVFGDGAALLGGVEVGLEDVVDGSDQRCSFRLAVARSAADAFLLLQGETAPGAGRT
jgi:hypothetical protein